MSRTNSFFPFDLHLFTAMTWVRGLLVVGLVMFAANPRASAQLVGDTIPITGDWLLTTPDGVPLDEVDPATLDANGGEVWNILQTQGFATSWNGLWTGNWGVRAHNDVAGSIPTLFSYGVVTRTGPASATYLVNVQRALTQTLYYNVISYMMLDYQGISGTLYNALYFLGLRNQNGIDKRVVVTPSTTSVSDVDFKEVPAVLNIQFYIGAPGNNQIYTATGSGNACGNAGKTPVNVTGGNLYVTAQSGNTYTTPPTAESTATVWFNTCCDYENVVVRGFADPAHQQYRISSNASIAYVHPTQGTISVIFNQLLGGLNYVEVTAPPMQVTSVCIPLPNDPPPVQRGCAIGYGDVYTETEIASTMWIIGSGLGDIGINKNGAIDVVGDPVTGEFTWASVPPGGYTGVRFQSVLDRPQTADGYPKTGDSWLRSISYTTTNKKTDGAAWDNITLASYPLPPGPVVPDQCTYFSQQGSDQPWALMYPSYATGTVTLYDTGTLIDPNATAPVSLIRAVDYYSETGNIKDSVRTYVVTYETSGANTSQTGGYSYSEPVPSLDVGTGQPYIDPNGNKSTGIFYHPVARTNNKSPDGQWLPSYWRTNLLVLRMLNSAWTDPEGYLDQIVYYYRQQPNAAGTSPVELSGIPVFPGQTMANQNFDVCFGIVRLTLRDAGGGTPKLIYDANITKSAAAGGFLVGDFEPLATGSPSKVGGPRIDIVQAYGSPRGAAAAAEESIVKMILPAGVYKGLNTTYYIQGGGSVSLPPFDIGVVGCGQTVEITPQLQISATAPPCVEQDNVGGFGVVGTVNSVPLGLGEESVDNAQIVSMWYTVDNGPQIMLNPAVHRTDLPGATEWGLTPSYGFDAVLPTECQIYHVKVSAQRADGTTTSSESITVYDDGQAPVMDCEDVTLVDVDLNGTEAGNLSAYISANDNCDVNSQISYFGALGVYPLNSSTEVVATGKDSCGNAATCTFHVHVVPPPIPDVAQLPTVTGQCSASVAANPPTATDYLGNTIVGIPLGPTSFTAQGTYSVTWQYTDGLQTAVTQNQTVIVDDTLPPVPANAALPAITAQCFAQLVAPKAIDNCTGEVTATTSQPMLYTALGDYDVTWTYTDAEGNSVQQSQDVSVVTCDDLDDCNGEETCDGANGCIPGTPVPLTECGVCASMGDVNGDGGVNVADTNCVIQVALWALKNPNDPPPTCAKPTIWAADLNCSGTFTVNDVQMSIVMVQYAAFGTPIPLVVDTDANGCPDTCHD